MKALSKNLAAGMLILATLLAFGSRATAETILQYSFGQAGPTTEIAGVTGGDIANGGSLLTWGYNTSDPYDSAPVLHTNPGGTVSADVDTAFANNNFFYFTLTPDSGTSLNLTSLSFNVARGGEAGTRAYGVRSNVTGDTNLSSSTLTNVRPNWIPITVDLSTYSGFQNLTSAVEFRFAVATESTGQSLEWDDITIEGTVVPEPSTFVLTALGLLGFACHGWRRKTRAS